MPYKTMEDRRSWCRRNRPLSPLAVQILHMLALAVERDQLFDPAEEGIHPWSLIALERRGLARRETEDLWRPTLKGLAQARAMAAE